MVQKTIVLALLLCCCAATAAFADEKLPAPGKDGGDGIFALLERRASGGRGDFPKGAVSREELSTILWAGSGLNRNGKGWTVPFAMGKPPYVNIFAVTPEGAFLYDWKNNALVTVNERNILPDITGDGFAEASPVVLVFVSDPKGTGDASGINAGNALAFIASGAMTQNIYLAADSLGISGRYMVSMKTDAVKKELKLKDNEVPLCIMPLAKR
ncbi:MAG: SagB/ThcOx family dehydrogenase [Synergistaceae bacterium]|jgi:hypothetical protein|nr:SagB/ThcOx family dehydrogenase [Synergistaceae bacterium]